MSSDAEINKAAETEHLKQADVSLEELYEQAREARPMLQEKADAILDHLKSQNPELFEGVRFELGPLKELDRAEGKVTERYKGDVTQITDLVRGRFVADTPEQIKALEQALRNDPEIAAIQNRFAKPVPDSGYRNISSETRLPNGHVAEIQIVQSDMLAVDEALHSRMAAVQEIKREAREEGRRPNKAQKREISALNKEMREISGEAAAKSGINELLDPEVRERFAPAPPETTAQPDGPKEQAAAEPTNTPDEGQNTAATDADTDKTPTTEGTEVTASDDVPSSDSTAPSDADAETRAADVDANEPKPQPPADAPDVDGDSKPTNRSAGGDAPSQTTSSRMNRVTGGVANAGATGYGLVVGSQNLARAVEDGDTVGIVASGADVVTSAADAGTTVVSAVRGAPVSVGVASALGKANVVTATLDIAYQVTTQEGEFIDADGSLGAKSQRLIGATTTTAASGGVAILAGGALATAGASVVVTVGAPLVLAGGVAYAGTEVVDGLIEVSNIYDQIDQNSIRDSQPGRLYSAGEYNIEEPPKLSDYKQCFKTALWVGGAELDASKINGDIDIRDRSNGEVYIANMYEIDWTDPQNLAEFERMIDLELVKQREILADNESWLHPIFRSQESIDAEITARDYVRMLEGAKNEVGIFREELQRHQEWKLRDTELREQMKGDYLKLVGPDDWIEGVPPKYEDAGLSSQLTENVDVQGVEALRNQADPDVYAQHMDNANFVFDKPGIDGFSEAVNYLYENGRLKDGDVCAQFETGDFIIQRMPDLTTVYDKRIGGHVAFYETDKLDQMGLALDQLAQVELERAVAGPPLAPEQSLSSGGIEQTASALDVEVHEWQRTDSAAAHGGYEGEGFGSQDHFDDETKTSLTTEFTATQAADEVAAKGPAPQEQQPNLESREPALVSSGNTMG